MDQDENLVFFSYTTLDRDRVSEVADALAASGVQVWMDYKRIRGGQDWNFEIRKALDRAAIIVVFVSKNSVNKVGYVQREIRLALLKAEEKLEGDIYLIPVLLDDDAAVPTQLKDIHYIKHSAEDFFLSLSASINDQLEKIGVEVNKAQSDSEIAWTGRQFKESKDGIPGYEVEMKLYRFSSEKYPHISEIGDYLKGELIEHLFSMRKDLINPRSDFFNFGQEKYSRMNTLDIQTQGPKINGRIMSISYSIHSYYAGAAHPIMGFATYNFFIEPLFLIDGLRSIFDEDESAFAVIQAEARRQLMAWRVDWSDSDENGAEDGTKGLDEDTVNRGTESWDDFSAFVFSETSIEVAFSPYQVAAYAFGPQFVEINYELVRKFMTREMRSALDLSSYFKE
ncbi:TIR domain-containing protein [Pararhizobium sp. A13]|uniref:TIR domain-containing protein n=1 Tax=Pararhizobium sp. A13 TaxID=3133975 RepID=UPI0032478A97